MTVPFDAQQLLAAARAQTGLEDFGPEPFVEPLERLLKAAAEEANLNEIGVMALQGDVERFLSNRLRFQQDLKGHPEILGEDVSDPIIVTGLPRTGTSKLQRMLSADPGVQQLLVWRLLFPAPLPGGTAGGADPRIAVAEQFAGMLANFPDFQAAHPTLFDEVDEDLLLFEMTFQSVVSTFRFRMPSYLEWVLNRPVDDTYRYVKSLLQYLQWQDGGRRGRPWVLKTPVHIGYLDAVAAVYPRATVVHCHRDPVQVIPSFARAVEASRLIGSSAVDAPELGREQLSLWSEMADRNLLLRDKLASTLRIIDVAYDEIRIDPLATVRRIHAAHGLSLTEEGRAAMEDWAAQNPQHRHGHHRYSLEQFDLDPDRIRQAFAAYTDRFGDLIGSA
jgi:hypothetical protein